MNKAPYPPAEDTWQTINAIKWLIPQLDVGSLIIDVGTGTGILIIASVYEALRAGYKPWGLATDIDINAIRSAKLNVINNGLHDYIDLINCNVLDCLRNDLRGIIIISNPPYLPGDWYEDWRIFGGESGRLVIDKLVEYACEGSVHYLVITQSSFSDWELTAIRLSGCGYKLLFLMRSHYFFEDIVTMVFIGSPARLPG